MNTVKISIEMLSYNRADYIVQAIESVLKQTFQDWELLIVDGGSTDKTDNIVNEYAAKDNRIVYIKKDRNFSISQCRNIGLRTGKGKYMAVLDSDDVWTDSDKLQKQFNFLEEKSKDGYVLVGGGVIVIDKDSKETSRYLNPADDAVIRKNILLRNPFAHSAVMFNREKALSAGGYGEWIIIGEEYDLWMRMGQSGKMHNLPEYLIAYRVHSTGACVADRLGGASDTMKIIKRYKNNYPNYLLAYWKRKIKHIFYSIVK